MGDRDLWDQKAEDWHTQVGHEGDANRRFNSDPFLWQFLGEVAGLSILDAGCGTGYLSRQLSEKGALVTGVDYSPKMIELASELDKKSSSRYYVDSCSKLERIEDASMDKIASNYVLMDLEDLDGAANSFFRTLKSSGIVVIVVTHPCFPQSDFTRMRGDGSVHYKWDFPYFEDRRLEEGPWKHFTSNFSWYHRPLRRYFRSFKAAGFEIVDFDEPVVSEPPPEGFPVENLRESQMRPNSVIFKLRKP